MKRKIRTISSDDLIRYMNFSLPVTVTFLDIVETGHIEFYDEVVVKINGNYFMKSVCEFYFC